MMKRLAYLVPLLAMIVLAFAAIALAQESPEQSASETTSPDGAQSPDPSEQTAPVQDTLTVSIGESAFDPAELSAAPGTTVTFVNEDTVPHTVVLDELFDSPELPPGYSYPVSFDGSGTVTYHDETNPDMQGSIIFGRGASQGEATFPEESTSESAGTTDDSTLSSEGSTPTGSSS